MGYAVPILEFAFTDGRDVLPPFAELVEHERTAVINAGVPARFASHGLPRDRESCEISCGAELLFIAGLRQDGLVKQRRTARVYQAVLNRAASPQTKYDIRRLPCRHRYLNP